MTTTRAAGPPAHRRVARLVPGGIGRGAWRVVERNTVAYSRQWYLFLTGLIEPALYLLSIGIGVGDLVGEVPAPGGDPVGYKEFVRARADGGGGDERRRSSTPRSTSSSSSMRARSIHAGDPAAGS